MNDAAMIAMQRAAEIAAESMREFSASLAVLDEARGKDWTSVAVIHAGRVTEINTGTIARQPFHRIRTYLEAAEIPSGTPGAKWNYYGISVRCPFPGERLIPTDEPGAPVGFIKPGSVSISFDDVFDNGDGELVDKSGRRVGTVDYRTGIVTFDHPRVNRTGIIYGRADL